jgi:hypothetical protein
LGVDFDTAVSILMQRQASDSLLKRHMIGIRDRYNGDWVIPVTEVEDEPIVEPPIPALVADSIDSIAMRAVSTRPQITVPAMNPTANNSLMRADKRRRAYYATWYESKLSLKMRRAVRHLAGYGTNCMGVVPNFDASGDMAKDRPRIEVRDPLTAYPDDTAPEEIRLPKNIGFIYPRSPDWIVINYPEAREYMGTYRSDTWDVFEWVDDENIYIGILGPRQEWGQPYNAVRGITWAGRGPFFLRGWKNRAGVVPYVCPGRVTLDRIAGQVTKMVGVIDMYAKLMALEAIAAEKAVFADKYILGREDGEISLVGGDQWKDGRTGEVNLVQGADRIGELATQVNVGTFQVADRLERSVRMSTGSPGVFGGEMNGSIRSGQTVTQLGAYAIDPRVQEVQEIMEYELSAINEAIFAVTKGYWPRQKFTVFSGWPSETGYVEFTPSKDFEDKANVVYYGFTGADLSQVTMAIGQAMQMKMMDRKTAMRKHPLVDNPDETEYAVIEEALVDSSLAATLAAAQQGQITTEDMANLIQAYRQTHDIVKANMIMQTKAQERQAAQAPPAGPGMAVPPETMPGTAAPGMGAEMQPPAGGPGGGPQGIAALLQALQGQGGAGAGIPPGVITNRSTVNA